MGAVHNIIDDRVAERRWLLNIAPAYHTPMSKKGGQAINRRIKRLGRLLDRMTPWRAKDKIARLKKNTERAKRDKKQAEDAVKKSAAIARRFGLD